MEQNEQMESLEHGLTVTVFDANRAELEQFKKDCKNLVIVGINDKDGYEAVKRNLKDLVSFRNRVDKRRKEFKNKVDEVGNAILNEIAPIEADLSSKKKAIDDEVARLKKEADELLAIKFKQRTDKMFAIDFKFNGSVYVLGHLSITEAGIKALNDSDFDNLIAQGTEVNEAAKKIAEALERTNQELEAKRKELAELDAKIAAQKAALNPPTMTFEQEAAMVRGEEIPNSTINIEESGDPVMVEVFQEDKADFFEDVTAAIDPSKDATPEDVQIFKSSGEILQHSKKFTPNITASVPSPAVEICKLVDGMVADGKNAVEIYLAGFNKFKSCAVKLVDSDRSITRKILLQEFDLFKPY